MNDSNHHIGMAPDRHVDSFIEDPRSDKYASFVLNLFRLPAFLAMKWRDQIGQFKLFCTWNGERYRVTGASRLGDIWLHSDFEKSSGYEERVFVSECSDWGPTP